MEVINIEDYLINVVASEMAANWGNFDAKVLAESDNNAGMNALKAQAVAARSFAINYLKTSGDNSTEFPEGIIGNTSRWQRYDSSLVSMIDKNNPSNAYYPAVQAVRETSNFVLVDARPGKGEIAPALLCSQYKWGYPKWSWIS